MTKRFISIGIGLVAWLVMAAQSCPASIYRSRLTNDGRGRITAEWNPTECRWEMTAVPDKGFVFKEWKDNHSTDNPRMLTESEIEANASYTAVFNEIDLCNSCIFHTKLTSTGELKGVIRATRLSCDICSDACEWQLTAKAKPGYVFIRWSDGITTNPRTVTLVKDATEQTYSALFMAVDGEIDSWNADGLVLTSEATDIMNGGSSAYARIFAGDWQYTPNVPIEKSDWGRWNMDFDISTLASHIGEDLLIRVYDECDQLAYALDTIVPAIVTSDANYSSLSLAEGADVQVIAGKLTVDADAVVNNLDIYANAKVTVPAGSNLTAERVYMRADGIDGTYPQLAVKGSLTNNNNDTVYYDYSLNSKLYYPLAVPYTVNCSEIRTKTGHIPSYAVQYYDGAERAMNASGWTDLDDLAPGAQIESGKGYNIYAVPRKWNGNRQQKVAVRFPMEVNLTSGEADKDVEVHLFASTNASNAHWNLIGAPYLTNTRDADDQEAIAYGYYATDPVSGQLVPTGTTLRYVTWSEDGFRTYTQGALEETDLVAFYPYFVQAAEDGYIHFQATKRLNAPKRRMPYEASNDNTKDEELSLGVILESDERSDRTGVLYSHMFTREYEVNADLVKLFGSHQPMTFYSLNDNNEPCAYNALPIEDIHTAVPLGFRNAPTGMLQISFDAAHSNTDRLEAVYLTDYMLGNTVNLMEESYEFYNSQKASDTRFALWAVVRRVPATATGMDETQTTNGHCEIYDLLGRRVNTHMQSMPQGLYILVENSESRKEVIR